MNVLEKFDNEINIHELVSTLMNEGNDPNLINDEVNALLSANKVKLENNKLIKIVGDNMLETPFEISEEVIRTEEQKAEVATPKALKQTNAKGGKKLNCTQEQLDFAKNVCDNKGKIYKAQDEGQIFTHRGAQVLFGGAGKESLRYKIAVSGFSDKEAVEYAVMYLDWDDTALYEEGGLAEQLKSVIGNPKPQIAPAIVAVGAK